MKAITTLAIAVVLATTSVQANEPVDHCTAVHAWATHIFQLRQNNESMPELMNRYGSVHSDVEEVIRDAYHPLWGMPAMSETGKEQRTREFANRAAERCYRNRR